MESKRRVVSSSVAVSSIIAKQQNRRRKCIRLLSRAALATTSLLLAGRSAFAQTGPDAWTTGNGDGSGLFSVGANWTGMNTPPISGDSISFGATTVNDLQSVGAIVGTYFAH